MNNEEQQRFVQSIYDGLFTSLTEAPPGQQAIYDRNKVFLTFEKTGRMLNSADYRNPWSPGNAEGSKQAAINFSMLANEAPVLQAAHTPSGVRISDIYRTILNAQITPQPDLNPTAKAEYDKAYAVLNRLVKDPEDPEAEPMAKPSQLLDNYNTNLTAYTLAQLKYVQQYFEAMKTPEGRASWPLIGPSLKTPVEIAYNTWRNGEATKVEDAQATIEFSSRNQVGRAFADAKKLFETYDKREELEPGNVHPRSRAIPSDWHSSQAARSWATRAFSSSSMTTRNDSEFSRYGGGASFSMGLFSIGGGGGGSNSRTFQSVEASSLAISFQYALVTIDRPWLTQLLFELPGWNLGAIPAGKYSNGQKDNNLGLLPLIPQSFIVTRNLSITANWSKRDIETIEKARSGSASVSFGPFSIGGGGGSSSSSSTTKFDKANGEIIVPNLQIMGWINRLMPFCPPA